MFRTDLTSLVFLSLSCSLLPLLRITKTILKGSVEDKLRRAAGRDNLSALVKSLRGENSMSTLKKSQVDWQISKAEEGDATDLEKATATGYVDKMTFLAQTDQRLFEREKEARNVARRQQEAKKRAQENGTAAGGGGGGSARYEQEEDDQEEESSAAQTDA